MGVDFDSVDKTLFLSFKNEDKMRRIFFFQRGSIIPTSFSTLTSYIRYLSTLDHYCIKEEFLTGSLARCSARKKSVWVCVFMVTLIFRLYNNLGAPPSVYHAHTHILHHTDREISLRERPLSLENLS